MARERRGVRLAWLASALLLLAGCASDPPAARSWLDPRTAASVQAMGAPWVYARSAAGLAANQRDYRSIGIVEVNRQGARAYYLGVVAWSTVDRSGLPPPPQPTGLRWAGDDRSVREPVGRDAASIGLSSEPFRPPSGFLGETWYRLSAAEVRALASVPAWIELVEGEEVLRFELWRGDRELLAPLLDEMP
jgi:hypothetical protein